MVLCTQVIDPQRTLRGTFCQVNVVVAHLCSAGQAMQGFFVLSSHGKCIYGIILLLIVKGAAECCAWPECLTASLIICMEGLLSGI